MPANPDFRDLFAELNGAGAEYLLVGGYALAYWTSVIDYPLNVGGRPFHSWPMFIPITFEVTILVAALTAVLGMLALNGLPMPYHPVFNVQRFALATRDRFFLCIEATDAKFDREATWKFLEGLHPRAVVLMIGTNNLGSKQAPADVAAGVSAVVQTLRHKLPHAQILLLGVFPRGHEANNHFRVEIKEVNDQIAKLDDGKHVHYLDIGDKFLEPNGELSKEIMPDYLHLSAKGYDIWGKTIKGDLEKLVQ